MANSESISSQSSLESKIIFLKNSSFIALDHAFYCVQRMQSAEIPVEFIVCRAWQPPSKKSKWKKMGTENPHGLLFLASSKLSQS